MLGARSAFNINCDNIVVDNRGSQFLAVALVVTFPLSSLMRAAD